MGTTMCVYWIIFYLAASKQKWVNSELSLTADRESAEYECEIGLRSWFKDLDWTWDPDKVKWNEIPPRISDLWTHNFERIAVFD